METEKIRKSLIKAIEEFEIIDSHEHLPPEKERVEKQVDVFTLFSHYTHRDLNAAGMSEDEYQSLYDCKTDIEERWKTFSPYWEQIRWGSYARAALLAVRKFYGFDDINEKTYRPISEAMRKANKPGIYRRVLKDACGIRTALTQCNSTKLETELLTPVMPIPMSRSPETLNDLVKSVAGEGKAVDSFDDFMDAVRAYILRVRQEGAAGLKMISNPYRAPSRDDAARTFEGLRSGALTRLPAQNPLRDYCIDESISFAAQQGLVIAVHTGYWGDFRELDPLHMIPLLQRHPKARFDIYHLGYPWVRQALMLGKGFPNVWLNLCWTHIISQRFAVSGLDEAVDLVPMNKILAFGGDYEVPVEKVYGHLVMAREDIAEVLSRRVAQKQMTEKEALELAKKWFCKNPAELYNLKV